MIEATFPFNDEVMREAYDLHRSVRHWPKFLRFLAVLACAWGAWLLAKEHSYMAGGLVLGGGVLVLLWPRAARALWIVGLRQNAMYGKEVRCRFDTKEMVMLANGQGMRLLWDDTFKIVEGGTGYLIYPKTGAFFYIPARGFATDIDAERVKGYFLAEKMQRA